MIDTSWALPGTPGVPGALPPPRFHPPLDNPRQDRWRDHFLLEGGLLVPLTATARVTVRLLNLNDLQLAEVRQLLRVAGVELSPS